jgi:hypothetical protein
MSHVSGPCTTLPGSLHRVPVGTRCDDHPDRIAVKRTQGETDSFGAEYHDLCQECFDKLSREIAEYDKQPKTCDWCGQTKTDCRSHRDMDEGQAGPVYDVCQACRDKESVRLQEELNEY